MSIAAQSTPALITTLLLTPTQWIQAVVLSAVPLGLYQLVGKTRAFKWTDVLRTTGILIIPFVVVLVINDVMAPMAATLVLAAVLAYLVGKIDTD